jgi:AmmeMemoRadiSam system protein B
MSEFDEEDDREATPGVYLPLATTLDEPMPALREVPAQIASVDADGKSLVQPAEDGAGDTVVILEDPEGLAQKPAVLSTMAYALATLFNGKRSANEAAQAFNDKYHQEVRPEQALELQKELDKALFLQSRRFERAFKKRLHTFLDNDVRAMTNAGMSYPAEPEALTQTIHGFFTAPNGPGELDKAPDVKRTTKISNKLRGAIIPHYDLRAAGPTYAHAYAEILRHSQAELFVILGVAHANPGNILYNVSTKNYDTPFGNVKTDLKLARRLQEASEGDLVLSELAHRTEHSVEFQAVLLAGLMAERKRDFYIVPILCGSVETFLAEDKDPLESKQFKNFTKSLRDTLEDSGKKWCIIASVDFSHIGPEYGHSTMIDERLLPAIKRGDMRLLKAAEKMDTRAFYDEVARTQNARHVDAVMATLTTMEVLHGTVKKGRLLHYDQMMRKNTHSACTYAALAFET